VVTAVCPGSFDPVTNGHVDIFARASRLFDEVVVAIGTNPSKTRLFSPEERIEMLREAVIPFENVTVAGFTGLLTDYCASVGAVALIKGVRGVTDFEYESPMAGMNRHLSAVETVFIPTSAEWQFVSSSLVKEVAGLGGDVSKLVPAHVHGPLLARLEERR
jgi:pantetheine-phosphate adenylyltransferase